MAVCIYQHLDFAHLDLLSQQRGFEVGLDDHFNLQFSAANLPHQRNNSERQDDVFSGAIPAGRGSRKVVHVTKLCHFIKHKQGFPEAISVFIHAFLIHFS